MDKPEFRKRLNSAKRVIIKVGSAVVSNASGVDSERIDNIAQSIAYLREHNIGVVLVSSGAVSSGMAFMNIRQKPDNIVHKQALASVGQPLLMNIYKNAFDRYGIKISQALITIDDILNRRRFINARNALTTLLNWSVVPIVNENDTVVIKELRFGDNDNLSAHMLNLIQGDALIILTDVDGVFDKNPKYSEDANLIEYVHQKDFKKLYKLEGKNASGSGGIKSKIESAYKVCEMGKLAVIANGMRDNAIVHLFNDENFPKTCFVPFEKPKKFKESWILNCDSNGVIVADDGAIKSILNNNSLLPSGIIKVYGTFERGDIVNIESSKGDVVAKCITNYDSTEIDKIKSHHSLEIIKILGYKYSNDVVHIDNIAILEENSA